jgi:hypothetical protein
MGMMSVDCLVASSRHWMHLSLEAFAQDEDPHGIAVHHCGVAVEHLLKAYLTSKNPVLVVEGHDFESLLHACGLAEHAAKPVTQIKTIGLKETFERAKRLLGERATVDTRDLGPVMDARNGVSHAGLRDPQATKKVLTTCVRICDPVLTTLAVDPQLYWGPYGQLHDHLINQHANDYRIWFEAQLARARHVYCQRFGHMSPTDRASVVQTIRLAQFDALAYPHHECINCPACGEKGYLALSSIPDEDEPGAHLVDYKVEWTGTFYPRSFDCLICELSLVGNEELTMASLPLKVERSDDRTISGAS